MAVNDLPRGMTSGLLISLPVCLVSPLRKFDLSPLIPFSALKPIEELFLVAYLASVKLFAQIAHERHRLHHLVPALSEPVEGLSLLIL